MCFLKFKGGFAMSGKAVVQKYPCVKDEPSLVLSFLLDLPYASEIIVALLNYGQ